MFSSRKLRTVYEKCLCMNTKFRPNWMRDLGRLGMAIWHLFTNCVCAWIWSSDPIWWGTYIGCGRQYDISLRTVFVHEFKVQTQLNWGPRLEMGSMHALCLYILRHWYHWKLVEMSLSKEYVGIHTNILRWGKAYKHHRCSSSHNSLRGIQCILSIQSS